MSNGWRHVRSQNAAVAEAGEESTPGGAMAKKARQFKTETVPLLHDIKKFNEEQDKEVEKFSSRRARMNKGRDEDF